MKILLIGSSGEIGTAIINSFPQHIICCPPHKVLDLADINSVKKWADGIQHLNWDALIYVAGINIIQPVMSLSLEILQQTIQVNTLSFIALSKLLNINTGGTIIAIGSIYSNTTRIGRIAYSTSKHGLVGAVKTLALEFANRDITVNCISPGFVKTKLTTRNNSQIELEDILNKTPLNRFVNMSDINKLCSFLLSQKSMTGQNLIIDAGYTI